MELLPVSLTLTKTWIPTSVLLDYAEDVTVIMPEPTDRTVRKAAWCIESECAALPSITLLLDRKADKMFLSDGIELFRGLKFDELDDEDLPATIGVEHKDVDGIQAHEVAQIVCINIATRGRLDRMLPIDFVDYSIYLYDDVCKRDGNVWSDIVKSTGLLSKTPREIVEKLLRHLVDNADDNGIDNFEVFKEHARESAEATRSAANVAAKPPPATDRIFSWEMFRIAPEACALTNDAWSEVDRKFHDNVGEGSAVTVKTIKEIIEKHKPGSFKRRKPKNATGAAAGAAAEVDAPTVETPTTTETPPPTGTPPVTESPAPTSPTVPTATTTTQVPVPAAPTVPTVPTVPTAPTVPTVPTATTTTQVPVPPAPPAPVPVPLHAAELASRRSKCKRAADRALEGACSICLNPASRTPGASVCAVTPSARRASFSALRPTAVSARRAAAS
jgi:hypothetical protein